VKRGECHRDYFLAAAHFQYLVDTMYKKYGAPPLEEMYWAMSSPQNLQDGTWQECPGIMIVAYLAVAEVGVTLFGPHASFVKDFSTYSLHMIRQMMYRQIVLNSWPIQEAFDSFQKRRDQADLLQRARHEGLTPSTYAVFIVCAHDETHILDRISELNPLPPKSKIIVRTPKLCDMDEPLPFIYCESKPECTPFGDFGDVEFVVFLPLPIFPRARPLFDLCECRLNILFLLLDLVMSSLLKRNSTQFDLVMSSLRAMARRWD